MIGAARLICLDFFLANPSALLSFFASHFYVVANFLWKFKGLVKVRVFSWIMSHSILILMICDSVTTKNFGTSS